MLISLLIYSRDIFFLTLRNQEKSDDGELVFSNQLIAAGRKNSFIRLGPETQLDLSCK